MSEKSICVDCKYCHTEEIWRPKPLEPEVYYACKCPFHMIPEKINYVTGKVTKAKYGYCLTYNKNGECSKFEKKDDE
jgi:hypothetical protein